jgi:hypothetical protein
MQTGAGAGRAPLPPPCMRAAMMAAHARACGRARTCGLEEPTAHTHAHARWLERLLQLHRCRRRRGGADATVATTATLARGDAKQAEAAMLAVSECGQVIVCVQLEAVPSATAPADLP